MNQNFIEFLPVVLVSPMLDGKFYRTAHLGKILDDFLRTITAAESF